MKVYEGAILTVDKDDSVAKFLVEDKGRIVFVGDELPKKYKKAKRVKLGDGCLIPSFVDSHQHFASFATFNAGLNVMDAESNAEIQEMARKFVKGNKSKMIIAFGASPYSVSDGVLISREQLDEVCPDKPMCVVKYDGHAAVVNSALLKEVDKDVRKLRGYHPDTGEMNQEAFFVVSSYITNGVAIPQLIKNMQGAVDHEAANGIGMIHTVSGVGFPLNLDINIEKWFGRSMENGFQLRVFSQSMNPKVALNRGFERIGGCFECALDGCFGSADAALNEPYEGTEDDYGVLYYSDEKVTNFMKKANRAGLQIEVHAIGDRAFDQATRCLKAALDDYPREDHRHGIIHDCFPTEEGIKICQDYNILMPMQTAFIGWKQEPDEYLQKVMGDRAAKLNPMRDLWDAGILISAGSDAPCTDPTPLSWIDHAVNNPSAPEQSLTIKESLRMCTYNGYYTTFDEKERGSLEEGKIADMVILSKNLYDIDNSEIPEVKVVKTILAGKDYKKLKKGFVATLISGMLSKKRI